MELIMMNCDKCGDVRIIDEKWSPLGRHVEVTYIRPSGCTHKLNTRLYRETITPPQTQTNKE